MRYNIAEMCSTPSRNLCQLRQRSHSEFNGETCNASAAIDLRPYAMATAAQIYSAEAAKSVQCVIARILLQLRSQVSGFFSFICLHAYSRKAL